MLPNIGIKNDKNNNRYLRNYVLNLTHTDSFQGKEICMLILVVSAYWTNFRHNGVFFKAIESLLFSMFLDAEYVY